MIYEDKKLMFVIDYPAGGEMAFYEDGTYNNGWQYDHDRCSKWKFSDSNTLLFLHADSPEFIMWSKDRGHDLIVEKIALYMLERDVLGES